MRKPTRKMVSAASTQIGQTGAEARTGLPRTPTQTMRPIRYAIGGYAIHVLWKTLPSLKYASEIPNDSRTSRSRLRIESNRRGRRFARPRKNRSDSPIQLHGLFSAFPPNAPL